VNWRTVSDSSFAKEPSSPELWRVHSACFWVLRLIILAAISSVPFIALPQTESQKPATDHMASLRGTVSATEKGYALTGATATLSGDSGQVAQQVVTTDDNGRFEFRNLTPGVYPISVEADGFRPATRSVELKRAEQNIEDFVLDLAAVSERVEVSESASTITTESASAPASVVSNDELLTLPTAQERVKEVLPTTPGVIQTLDGKLTLKGSDENQSLLVVNSARNTDPATGSFGIVVPTDAVESFSVYKTPYDASLGKNGGLTLKLEGRLVAAWAVATSTLPAMMNRIFMNDRRSRRRFFVGLLGLFRVQQRTVADTLAGSTSQSVPPMIGVEHFLQLRRLQ
jgi:Carboxypeptidase regulatory-like domain/TonB-dependent Receptor Plug Domain